ncbi:hypothetical protein ACT009_14715 [Sphingomonas sp. Tas61C01]|uniref:hypothetical protein n=1 Tax=Sphingomonas sp. Tas61C01 TaxID=3458297 RepID=UPI00403EA5EA
MEKVHRDHPSPANILDNETPRYLEAYPELDVELLGQGRGARSGSRRVTWYTEWHEVAGVGELTWPDEGDEFLISCEIYPGSRLEAVEKARRIRFDFLQRGLYHYRTCATCPACRKNKVKLYLKDDWACAECQGLRPRSRIVPAQQLLVEQIDLLHGDLKEGRPVGMPEALYRKKLGELDALKAKRDGPRKRPDARFRHAVYAVWDKREKRVGSAGQ